MDGLAGALAAEGGLAAGRASTARLRALVGAELEHGERELGRKRSGVKRPVLVVVAPALEGLRAIAPVTAAVRADPDAAPERAWLLVAALVGALVETTGTAELSTGELDGWLVLAVAGDPADAEVLPLAFDEHVGTVDRLRAGAVAVPGPVLGEPDDVRAPIGAAHPLLVAARVAALGGRPADEASVAEHEEAALEALEAEAPAVARPHDDPDPARRVARRILQRLDGMGKWGGYHTEFAHLARGFAGNDRALAEAVGEALLASGVLSEKPSVGQRHVFLNPGRAADIRALVDDGAVPEGLRLP
jgi:hypothetical protein